MVGGGPTRGPRPEGAPSQQILPDQCQNASDAPEDNITGSFILIILLKSIKRSEYRSMLIKSIYKLID